MFAKSLILATFVSAAVCQQSAWGQCGGKGWTGPTTCISGWSCVYSNDYYSQCLQGGPSTTPTKPTTTVKTTTSSPTTKSKTTTSSSTSSSSPSSSPVSGGGPLLKASFTEYGSTDSWGSGNCNVKTVACFFYTSPGYSAAVSQNLYGVGPGAGAGPACGTCYKLTIQTDSSGNKLPNAGNSIVVMVTNLCPAQGNPLCSQSGLSGTNQYGANVNFDTCIDSGASAALFGNSGVGLGLGTAQQVDCSLWSGSVVH